MSKMTDKNSNPHDKITCGTCGKKNLEYLGESEDLPETGEFHCEQCGMVRVYWPQNYHNLAD